MVHEDDTEKKNQKVAKVAKRMKNKEHSCKMHSAFRTYLKAAHKAALSRVDVPDYLEMWRVIYINRGKWGWAIVFAILVWGHAVFHYQALFTTNVPHKRVVGHEKLDKCLHKHRITHFGQAQGAPSM
eukprot:11057287-Ditylum_brightwellii.AAC.1